MNKNRKLVSILIGLGLPIFSLIVILILYENMPSQLPTKWNMTLLPTSFGAQKGLLIALPLAILILTGVRFLLPYVDPKRTNYLKFQDIFFVQNAIFSIFLIGVLSFYVLNAVYPTSLVIPTAFKCSIALIVCYKGNLLPKIKDNFFIGIVNAWTIASHKIWYLTHRFAGKLYVLTGLIIFVLSFINKNVVNAVYGCLLVMIMFMPHLYSAKKYYVTDEKNRRLLCGKN